MFNQIVKLRNNQILTNYVKCTNICSRTYASTSKIPELAKDRYPIKRGAFSEVTNNDVSHFESILEKSRVISDKNDCDQYNLDFLGTVRGFSQIVLKPKTTAEVSEILKYCNKRKLAICPQGGNTGLVGGSVPIFDEIILSTQLMNHIEKIDDMSGTLICQPGCVLQNLEENASNVGLCMPLDLGAKGTCHIGGNLSTNAGGIRLIRYGNLHGSVLGVEVVKADGTILDLMSNFKKDNTGYHLKHMFIGSEGTLGIITKLAIFCPTASKSVHVAFVGLENYDKVLKTFLSAKQELGEILSACEMIDKDSLECSVQQFNLNCPIGEYPFYMLFETSGSREDHDCQKITKFLESALERNDILDGTITSEPGKMNEIWKMRELIANAIVKDGYCYKYDLSLPLTHFYDIVPVMKNRVGHLIKRIGGYGHIGDSNLHLNISASDFSQELYKLIEPFVFEYTSKLGGSISAEHGIGFLKPQYLKYSKRPEALKLMQQMKLLMDPNGILNPYKVLRDSL